MHKYWKEVHDKSLADMRALVRKLTNGNSIVEDTRDDMKCALAYVMKHGDYEMAADAYDCFDDYKWVSHEIAAHEAQKNEMKAM